jgi:hypothetical protein
MEKNTTRTVGEQTRIAITEGDIGVVRDRGEKCLVGRVWTDKIINKEAFRKVISRFWRTTKEISFKEIQDNLWIFEFSNEEEKKRVMEGRPWAYERQIMILNELEGQVPPSQMEFIHTPVWIQIHDMPLHCMSRAVGTKIGETLGVLEEVDAAADGVGWGRFLRIRVRIDITKPLERGRELIIGGKAVWVSFKYENLPLFCFHCGCIVHGVKGCPVKKSRRLYDEEGVGEWGLWLRADEPCRKLEGRFNKAGGEGRFSSWQRGQSPDGEKQRTRSPELESSASEGNPSNPRYPEKASKNFVFNSQARNVENFSPREKESNLSIKSHGIMETSVTKKIYPTNLGEIFEVNTEARGSNGSPSKSALKKPKLVHHGPKVSNSPTSLRKMKNIARKGGGPISVTHGANSGMGPEGLKDDLPSKGQGNKKGGEYGFKRKRESGPSMAQTWAKKEIGVALGIEGSKTDQGEQAPFNTVVNDSAEVAMQPRRQT